MKISDLITQRILELMDSADGIAEIQRNDFASQIGCVPSQINYVLTSRFTPEQGYVIESRRGGGGYIRITRVQVDAPGLIMHVVNTIGGRLDEKTARILLENLTHQEILSLPAARLMLSAVSEQALRDEPDGETREKIRASIFKNMLLSLS